MKYIWTLTIWILSLSSVLFAQKSNELGKTKSAVKLLKEAQEYINKSEYDKAKPYLLAAVKKKKKFAVAYRELAKVHLMLDEYDEATGAYEESFRLDPKLSRAAYYECGEAYFKSNDFEKANRYYKKYKALKGRRYSNAKKEEKLEKVYDSEADERQRNYEFFISAIQYPVCDTLMNVGSAVNTSYDEYLPTVSSDGGTLIYTTEKSYAELGRETGENIFVSRKGLDGSWQPGHSINKAINSPQNEGMAKFASNERYMYFAGCERSDSEGGCDIYQAKLFFSDVVEITPMEGNLNSEFWDSQPSISCDGSAMYFVSSREGGFGGSDVWVSYRRKDGSWDVAENMGPLINTTGDEQAPYIAPDGETMYFSSTGHLGMGSGDIFIVRLNPDGTWGKPKNMGYPINTQFQELGFYIKPDNKMAYIASARSEGFGGLDVYEFELPKDLRPEPMVFLEGLVTEDFNDEPLSLEIELMRNGKKRHVRSDEEGWYFVCLPANKAYAFQVGEEGYVHFMEAAFFPEQENAIPARFDITLLNIEMPDEVEEVQSAEVRADIFFDINSTALTSSAKATMSDLIRELQADNRWQIEVIGYADNTGSADKNKILSQQRATAVVNYLREQGVVIDPDKVHQEGRGEVRTTDESFGEVEAKRHRRVEIILRK